MGLKRSQECAFARNCGLFNGIESRIQINGGNEMDACQKSAKSILSLFQITSIVGHDSSLLVAGVKATGDRFPQVLVRENSAGM